MPDKEVDTLTQLTETVLVGAKYREIAPELVRLIGRPELTKRNNLKAVVKKYPE